MTLLEHKVAIMPNPLEDDHKRLGSSSGPETQVILTPYGRAV